MPTTNLNGPRVRLFENKLLEQLTLMSPGVFAIFWAIALPLIAWTGWGAVSLGVGLALILAGIGIWTVFEYAMHRYLFHLETNVKVLKWFVFLIHGNHHHSPNDPLRGLMPLPASLPVAGLIWLMFDAILGKSGTWLFLGFMTGYVMYDVIHFACHQLRMKGRIGSAIKRHHMRHHYVDENRNYAISAIFWDYLFGSQLTSVKQAERGGDD